MLHHRQRGFTSAGMTFAGEPDLQTATAGILRRRASNRRRRVFGIIEWHIRVFDAPPQAFHTQATAVSSSPIGLQDKSECGRDIDRVRRGGLRDGAKRLSTVSGFRPDRQRKTRRRGCRVAMQIFPQQTGGPPGDNFFHSWPSIVGRAFGVRMTLRKPSSRASRRATHRHLPRIQAIADIEFAWSLRSPGVCKTSSACFTGRLNVLSTRFKIANPCPTRPSISSAMAFRTENDSAHLRCAHKCNRCISTDNRQVLG